MTKRKKQSGKTTSAKNPPMPSFSSFEKLFANLDGGVNADVPLVLAQELVYQAWDIPNPAKRVALAKQALALCADCADAYVLLAEEQSQTLEDALERFEQAVAAGERALGPDAFESDVGHFWGLHETRPYMRARLHLALTLWEFGDRSAAIAHARDMLRLNPNDNQGVRYVLVGWYLLTGDLAHATALIKEYDEDAAAVWSWSRALMQYMKDGDSAKANALLDEAIAGNPHIPPLLLGRKPLSPRNPGYVGRGDASEATTYVHDGRDLWAQTDGALRWLSRRVPAR